MRKVHADVLAGLRIFRMLQEKKQLEQKQIAEFAMVPVREAREVLYKMLKGGFLALQVCCACQTGQSNCIAVYKPGGSQRPALAWPCSSVP